jgi:DNA mismatch repair protein MutS
LPEDGWVHEASILFRPDDRPDLDAAGALPPFAIDLHLDEIVAALGGGQADAGLAALCFARLRDPDAVAFRHEVFRDLEAPGLRDGLTDFIARMGVVDEHLAHASAIAHPLERQRWQLEAANAYQSAVATLAETLKQASATSRGLTAFSAGLRVYVDSETFTTLVADTSRMLAELADVTYRLRIGENRVIVGRHDGEADYGAEVLATFGRFRRSATPEPVPVDIFRTVDMNLVEIGILERVVRVHPAVFGALEAYVQRHGAFLDPAVATFASELPFYLGWLDLIRPLQDVGLAFCYPEVSTTDDGLAADGLFDLAFALRRAPAGDGIVINDLELSATERLLVITGPNQGGKTAFARAIGQLQHLASIGVLVPGSEARVGLGDAVHTLFARAEDPADLTGRLEAELTRARTILDALRPGSLVIMNESFASTTVDDALVLNRALIGEMVERGAICVVVTFLGELAVDAPGTVSMTGVMDPLDPTRPTFRLERRTADPLAHARAVADVHGLGYDAVRARIAERAVR